MKSFILALFMIILPASAALAAPAPGAEVLDTKLDALLDQYIAAHDDFVTYDKAASVTRRGANTTQAKLMRAVSFARQGGLIGKIKDLVFDPGSRAQYTELLQRIDARGVKGSEADAIYDLSRGLQKKWEISYGFNAANRNLVRMREGKLTGKTVFLFGALGVSIFYHPENVPKYFALFRTLFIAGAPILGDAAGALGASGYEASGVGERGTPAPPAFVMHLGVAGDSLARDDEEKLERDVEVAVTSSAISSSAIIALQTTRVIDGISIAVTPFKINPLVLVLSIAGTFVIEAGINAGFSEYDWVRFQGAVTQGCLNLRQPSIVSDDYQVYTEADELVRATTSLMNYISGPIIDSIGKFNDSIAVAHGRMGDTPAFAAYNQKQSIKFGKKVSAFRNSDAYKKTILLVENAEAAIRATGRDFIVDDADSIRELLNNNNAALENYIEGTAQ